MQLTLYNDMNDTDLWSLLLRGDQNVLEVLYKRHYALLLNYGLKCCIDKELIKDCIQDIFIKLHKSQILSTTASPRVYLLKSLRNAIYDKLSTQKESYEFNEETFFIPDSQDLFEHLFAKSDEDLRLAKQLLNAISQLPANQKSVLYFRYVKELSYKEIAEIMDFNVQSSMNLANKALSKLRTMFEDNQLKTIQILLIANEVLG